ncbi:hypothetical protein DICVIV_06482 [Dictyocaulus viviparus]|uniref:Uncharacterized protein n=1 Tax=Dictyocaulus viviparus TaxID=29172 RepID=A0A0D8XYL3_DICVI|nr:hypothetical protein DICVIV_06482 [Dictyocaulus viviparus]
MKVFTVGLDDKERSLKIDAEKADQTKVEMPVSAPPPIVMPRTPAKKRFGWGVLSWIVAAFFIVLLCLTISEITYNRQRDQAFLRLKWAELRQRLLGFEFLTQVQPLAKVHSPNPVNEISAFPRRTDLIEEQTTTTATPALNEIKQVDTTTVATNNEFSHKFDLLRMILSKIRDNVEEMGLDGDMQVHVIEMKPQYIKMSQQSIDDAFGEVAMPKQSLGPWQNEEIPNDLTGK